MPAGRARSVPKRGAASGDWIPRARRPALASVLRSLAIEAVLPVGWFNKRLLSLGENYSPIAKNAPVKENNLTYAREEASRYSDTIDRTRLFGVRPRCASGAPVIGDVFLPVLSQASMDDRSYVLPSAAITGCCISSIDMVEDDASERPGGKHQ